MKELVLIKLGGSVITDKSKPFTARLNVIDKLARKVKAKFISKDFDLIVGHGGGSFPHVPAAKYQVQKGITNKKSVWGFCLTADAAIQINRIVVGRFLKYKIPAVSFAPLSFITQKSVSTAHIQKAMEIGAVPVIYGDLVMNDRQGFEIYSGEKSLDVLATKLKGNYKKITIIYYTDTFGVYDNNGKTIPLITPSNYPQIKKFLVGSGNTDVTGGMLHKVEESLKLVKKLDALVYIVNGLSKGSFTKISKHVRVDTHDFEP